MKIILLENNDTLGKAGDILKVADGYARNYLIPRGLAVESTSKTLKNVEQEKKHILLKIEREKKKADILVEKMKGVACTISRRVGEQDKLFGSVTTKDVEKSLSDQGIEIDRKMIVLEEPIKALGDFPVKIRLQAGISTEIRVIVVADSEE